MARRRGLSIALQTALGALSGAAGGYAQQEEMKRKREREGKEAEERRALNLASLYGQGFQTAEQKAQQEEQMGMAGARLLSAMKSGARVTDQDVNLLSQAAVTKGRPAGRITYGGQELELPETRQSREERLQSLAADRLRLAKEQEARTERSALDTVLSAYGSKIRPEDRVAIMTGNLTLSQALERGTPRQPAPVDPVVARQRQSLLESRTAQSYVEAAQGDAVKAYADYKAQNPRAPIPEREFKSAAYRLQNKTTNADAVSALVNMLLNPSGAANP
jgi:hypothetical protein